MKQEKQTAPQGYEALMQQRKEEVCRLLRWTEMQYAENQYKAGIAYLMWYLPCDERTRQDFERSKLYWNWFKMCWTEYDQAYISSEGIEKIRLQERRRIYNDLHCPRTLAVEKKPNRIVLDSIKTKQPVL